MYMNIPDLVFILHRLWWHHKNIKSNNVIKIITIIVHNTGPTTATSNAPVLSPSLSLDTNKQLKFKTEYHNDGNTCTYVP